jgi:hypothetical protein
MFDIAVPLPSRRTGGIQSAVQVLLRYPQSWQSRKLSLGVVRPVVAGDTERKRSTWHNPPLVGQIVLNPLNHS